VEEDADALMAAFVWSPDTGQRRDEAEELVRSGCVGHGDLGQRVVIVVVIGAWYVVEVQLGRYEPCR